ncbi:PepSY domain-containing protein [bacterium LRH843]|nr:PepSY domain-containing protein [bacterium LRH843]
MKKWTIGALSLLLVGSTAVGVAASGKTPFTVDETAVVTPQKDVKPVATNNQKKQITKEEAVASAQKVLAGEVEEVKLDLEDGRLVYEVELRYEGEDYDFDIDAYSGEVVNVDDDLAKINRKKTQQKESSQPTERLSEDQAIEIALNHVGGGNVEDVDLDRKNGRFIYEVEINDDTEVKIDAATGEVLYVDWD